MVDLNELRINYYPNPVRDVLTIRAQDDMEWIRIFNQHGQEVFSQFMNTNQSDINLSNLVSGTNFMQVRMGNQLGAAAIIKQ